MALRGGDPWRYGGMLFAGVPLMFRTSRGPVLPIQDPMRRTERPRRRFAVRSILAANAFWRSPAVFVPFAGLAVGVQRAEAQAFTSTHLTTATVGQPYVYNVTASGQGNVQITAPSGLPTLRVPRGIR